MKLTIKKKIFSLIACSLLLIPISGMPTILSSCSSSEDDVQEAWLKLTTIDKKTSFKQSDDNDLNIQLVVESNVEYFSPQIQLQWLNDSGSEITKPSQIIFNEQSLTFTLKSVKSSSEMADPVNCNIKFTGNYKDKLLETNLNLRFQYSKIEILINDSDQSIFTQNLNSPEQQRIIFSLGGSAVDNNEIDNDSITWSCVPYIDNTNTMINFTLSSNGNYMLGYDSFLIDLKTNSILFNNQTVTHNNYRLNLIVNATTVDNKKLTTQINIYLNASTTHNSFLTFDYCNINYLLQQNNQEQTIADFNINDYNIQEVLQFLGITNDDIKSKYQVLYSYLSKAPINSVGLLELLHSSSNNFNDGNNIISGNNEPFMNTEIYRYIVSMDKIEKSQVFGKDVHISLKSINNYSMNDGDWYVYQLFGIFFDAVKLDYNNESKYINSHHYITIYK